MDPSNILIIVLVAAVVLGFIYFNIIFPMMVNKKEKQEEISKSEVSASEETKDTHKIKNNKPVH